MGLTFEVYVILIYLVLASILTFLFFHRKVKKRKMKLLIPMVMIFHLAICFIFYVSIYYHADDKAKAVMTLVNIKEEDKQIFFDGPGSEDVMIFYPGAKVEAEAYAPLLEKIAEGGVDCYLLKTPFHLAVLGANEADQVDVNGYKHVYVSGHSMGGAVAGLYAAKHKDTLSGVIFLAAYPTKDLKQDGFRALSIVGSNDGGYDKAKWEDKNQYMPADYTFAEIAGGNHGNFGNYGFQKGDKEASISREEQQEETAKLILDFIGEENK